MIRHEQEMYNGVKIPSLGYGCWKAPQDQMTIDGVAMAIEYGFRHIDGAAAYLNEEFVGEGIKISGVDRKELFLTSKLRNPEHGYYSTLKAFEKTINEMKVDYLDLYLIHWPVPVDFKDNYIEKNIETWKAFEKLYKVNKVRSIGISNFMPHHIDELMSETEIKPMVNQIEFHPSFMQTDLINYCRKFGMVIEGYSPLANGRVFKVQELNAIAEKYDKTVAQICIRWALQHDIVTLTKSVTPERIKSNLQVFDFEISDDDMNFINSITTCEGSGNDPENITW